MKDETIRTSSFDVYVDLRNRSKVSTPTVWEGVGIDADSYDRLIATHDPALTLGVASAELLPPALH